MVLPVLMVSGCESGFSGDKPDHISWQGLHEGQTVYGIVKLAVEINGQESQDVKYYLDTIDGRCLLGLAERESGSIFTIDWYTQEAANGAHVIFAVVTYDERDPLQITITMDVNNRWRADAVPPDAIKMTPANDSAPPRLHPGFDDIWHEPIPLEGPVNTAGAEDSPFITPDGNTLYFWFNGDQSKDVHEQVKDSITGLYRSEKVDGEWQEPERLFLQYFDKIGFDGDPTVHGDTLWFGSIREGNYRDIDIWAAELINGRWVSWTNAGELLNKTYEIGELHITADGNDIYFGSTRPRGKGESDIWITRKVNGHWQEPENVTVVNTAASEGQPFISEDGNELWFTRLTPGPAIYRSINIDNQWQTPELVLSTLAGEPTLDANGNLYFVHHRWDDTLHRVTEADIYVCYRK